MSLLSYLNPINYIDDILGAGNGSILDNLGNTAAGITASEQLQDSNAQYQQVLDDNAAQSGDATDQAIAAANAMQVSTDFQTDALNNVGGQLGAAAAQGAATGFNNELDWLQKIQAWIKSIAAYLTSPGFLILIAFLLFVWIGGLSATKGALKKRK